MCPGWWAARRKTSMHTGTATPSESMAVEPHNTRPTTNGISTAAVTTRFHVIERESPANSQASSHHIEGNKSRGTNIPQVFCTGSVPNYENLPGAGGAVVI